MKPRHTITAITAAALTIGLVLTGAGGSYAITGNRTCPPVVHTNTDGFTTVAAGSAALHASKGVVLKTTAANEDKVTWTGPGVDVKLKSAGQLGYQTETLAGHTSAAALPSYFLTIDVNDDGSADTKLIFEPYYQAIGNPSGLTTVWDVDAGKWWSNSGPDKAFMAGWPLNEKAGGSYAGNKTLAEIGVLWPEAAVVGYGVNLGTYNPGVVARVNDVRFGCVKHEWLPAPVQPTGTPSATPTGSPTGSPSVTPSGTTSPTASASVTATPSSSTSASLVVVVPAGNSGEALPVTGSRPLALVWVGMGLLVAGVLVLVLRARRTKFTA